MPALAELVFGDRARELGARGRPPGPRDGWVRVRLDPAALRPPERAELARLGTLIELPSGEVELTSELGALAELAERSLLGACLAAAWTQAVRPIEPPELMGVVNVTPDSFSDGGRYLDPERAIAHGLELARQGARWLDVGGESTRPGSEPVPPAVELERVMPVLTGLAAAGARGLSIDTSKAEVARAALDAGAELVNDVTAGRGDARMLELVAERGAGLVLMHMRGRPKTMQRRPRYRDVVAEVARFLRGRVARCLNAGIDPHKIVLDPGIGFGKLLEHNLDLLRRLPELRSLGRPLLLGVSRKRFVGELGGAECPAERLGGTAAAVAASVLGGARILRVHDVAPMLEAARVAHALIPLDRQHDPCPSPSAPPSRS